MRCPSLLRCVVAYWHFASLPRVSKFGRYWSAASTDRRNTGVESFCWGFKLQSLTGPFVELASDFIQMGL